MTLPKIAVPTFNVIIGKKEFTLRPFLISEEKLLLLANSTEDIKDSVEATKQVVKNCLISVDGDRNYDINKLYVYELEYLILQLRKASVSPNVDIVVNPSKQNCEKCNKERTYKINLDDVKLDIPDIDTKFLLTDNIGICLHYPIVKDILVFSTINDSNLQTVLSAIWKCVSYVFEITPDGEQITYAKDVTEEEGIAFLESLNANQFKLIENFYNNLPQLTYTLNLHCKACGHDEKYVLKGLSDFFV